jgi:hypothetical protein
MKDYAVNIEVTKAKYHLHRKIIKAVHDWLSAISVENDIPGTLIAYFERAFYGENDRQEFVDNLASVIWTVSEGYCQISVTFTELLPKSEEHIKDQAGYNTWKHKKAQP